MDRLNEVRINNEGYTMKIVGYINQNNITVEFQDSYKYKVNTKYDTFKSGSIKNNFHKSIYNVACLGNAETQVNKVVKDSYKKWRAMIDRCYSGRYEAYKDCYVCEEWLTYENFDNWYNNNVYKLDSNSRLELDKDILMLGNKLYSPIHCILVPQKINMLFSSMTKTKGYYKREIGFVSMYNKKFDTQYDAYNHYKENKENDIIKMAKSYKEFLPSYIYYHLINYKLPNFYNKMLYLDIEIS